MNKDNFILFSDCIPVKGANRSLICDLKNNKYHFIPNGLYKILDLYEGKTIDFIKKSFNNSYDDVIDEYFNFLLVENLIFFNSDPELFPKINLEWKSPSTITNMIIDYDDIDHDFKKIVQQLEILKCSHIQIRFFKETSLEFISSLLEIINIEDSRILSIDLVFPYRVEFINKKLENILKKYPRIHSLVIYNSPNNLNYPAIAINMGYILFVKRNITNEKHCGIINQEYFYSNITLFSESQHHNTCLNRKISVDKNGDIKNCPSIKQSFGNIQSSSLEEALNHKDFKKYWNIKKDDIEICKDCEFRHVCTDCRGYIENTENILSKPLKCGYDPYTSTWQEWSTNILKQKAIKYYDLSEIFEN